MRFAFLTAFLISANWLHAQLPTPELLQVYPPIAKAGSTVEVTLQGTYLEGLEELRFALDGIVAKPVLLPQSPFRKNRYQNGTKFTVTIPANTPAGKCEVRAIGHYGISNSRIFTIVPSDRNLLVTEGSHEMEKAPALALDADTYGRFDNNQVDHYKVTMKKGQRIIATCFSEAIDGDADPTLLLKDKDGLLIDSNRDYEERASLIDFEAPADGTWWIGVHDFTFTGGKPYHLHLTTGPHIDAIFPPSGKAGTKTKFTIFGRNLPGGSFEDGHEWDDTLIETVEMEIDVPSAPTTEVRNGMPINGLDESFLYRFGNSAPKRIGIDTIPTTVRTVGDADQTLTLPAAVSGYWTKDGKSEHQYRFSTKKGKVYELHLQGESISGRIDPYLVVEQVKKDAEGKETFQLLKESDDFTTMNRNTFPNLSRDPRTIFTASVDGEVQATVIDQYRTQGFASLYRLKITEAAPDFHLIASVENNTTTANIVRPSAVVLRKGGSYAVPLEVLRTGDFEGEIIVSAEGLPPKVSMPPLKIPLTQSKAIAVFLSEPDSPEWHGTIRLVAKAKIGDNEIAKPVRSASIVNAATDIRKQRLRTRLETEFALSIIDIAAAPATIVLKNTEPLTIEIGQSLKIPFNFSAYKEVKGNVLVNPIGLPTMKKPPALNLTADKKEGVATISFKPSNDFKPTAGTYTFVLRGTGTLGKYQHYPERVTQLKEDLAFHAEKLKTLKPEDAELRKQADAEKKKLDAELKAATAVSKEKDVTFGIYSAPIEITVTEAPKKK